MLQRPKSCEGCPLHDNNIAIGFMAPEGTGSSGVMVVAEALGAREAYDGLPLRPNAPAGSVFQGIIRRIPGLDRNQLLLSNTIWCQPGSRNYLDGAGYEFPAIEHCQQHNKAVVAARRPRAIVTLGAIPTRTITGFSGYNQGIKLIRGYILPSNRPEYMVDGSPIPVIPTYHPSFLLRASKTRSKGGEGELGAKTEKAEGGMALSGVVRRDIELALKIAREGPPPRRKFETIKGNREVMDDLIREVKLHPELPLAWDIETPRSIDMADDESEIDSIQASVTQIQFALDGRRGFVFPGFMAEWVLDGTRSLLASPNRKYSWNGWKFDNKVVQGHWGIPILGEDIDLMTAWAWIQPDLPKGLQFATSFYAPDLGPWKHLAISDEDTYGACDVISLHMNAEGIFQTMAERGLRTSYDRHVLMLRGEMVDAQHRGLPVDVEAHIKFGNRIYEEIGVLENEIRTIIPEAVLGIEPKGDNKKKVVGPGYVGIPRQISNYLGEDGLPRDGSDRVTIREEVSNNDEDGNLIGTEIKEVVYTRRSVEVFDKEDLENKTIIRWVRLVPFSVGSGPQKIKYIEYKRSQELAARLAKGQDRAMAERLCKYKVPKVRNKQKEMKDNTGAREIEKLYKDTGDPVFRKLVDIGKRKKMYGTYVKGWDIKNGYLHTTYGYNTGTGQLTSKEPNVQNLPNHSELGKELRACIMAKPRKVLLEFDKKAFHAQTIAFEAKDKEYARLAAIDVHSYNAAWRLKLPEAPDLIKWSDADLKAWIKMKKGEPLIYKQEACVAYPDGMTFAQVRDFKTKKVGLGINFAQGAQSLFEQNPEGYKSKKEVQDLLDMFFSNFPKLKKFQNETAQLAHKQTYLQSRWGYIRRFYDVYQWDSAKWNEFSGSFGDWRHGDDFEAAGAFPVANDAHGMIKEEVLRLGGWSGTFTSPGEKVGEDLAEKYGFCNMNHDSLFFHCDNNLKDKCIEDVLGIMRQRCVTLTDSEMAPDGLFVDAEGKVGSDWAHMTEIKGV